MICQACRTYDPTGASPIKCPNCDATIGETHEMRESERKPTTPIMYFFELKDKLTVNAIVYHAKAVSSADAKGALRNFYIQTGVTKYSIHCNEKTMTEEEIRKRPGYSGYLVWEGSDDDKIVVMRK